jgi:hypothetical protein
MEIHSFNAVDVWEKLGITEHLGGIVATQRAWLTIAEIFPAPMSWTSMCTGFTACLLAQQ